MQGVYVGISIAAFIAILVLLVLNRQKIHRISTLTMLGMTMIVLGIVFGDSRWISYSLMGAGVLFAVIDAKYVKGHRES
jgi:cytochrome c biogenesis factor